MTRPRLDPRLQSIPPYVAGRSIKEVADETGFSEVIKLCSNESPIGPSPLALDAARRALNDAHRYPGTQVRDLRQKLARRLGHELDEDNIIICNGGADALRLLTQVFVFDGGNTVVSRTTFPLYRILTTTFGGEVRVVDPAPDYRHDLDAMASHIDTDTRLIYLCSPNNPSGHVITRTEAARFLERVPDRVVVIFDESYVDFATDPECVDSLAWIQAKRNVFSVRSFSKSAGLANLRVGYLVGTHDLVAYARRAQLPFNGGDVALAAASASLDDEAFQRRIRETVWQGRSYIGAALRRMHIKYLDGQANFVTIIDPPPDAETLARLLLQQKIVVRLTAPFGLPNGIRVSVGTMPENQALVEALGRNLSFPCAYLMPDTPVVAQV